MPGSLVTGTAAEAPPGSDGAAVATASSSLAAQALLAGFLIYARAVFGHAGRSSDHRCGEGAGERRSASRSLDSRACLQPRSPSLPGSGSCSCCTLQLYP